MQIKIDKVSFENSSNHKLSAVISSLETPIASIVFAHCFTCGKDLKAAKSIANQLAEAGYAVMRFDFTGLGASEGLFADTSFSSNKSDLKDAINYMNEHYAPTKMLIGHSLGGTAVLSIAGDIPTLKAVATIGSPFEADHVTHLFADHVDEIKTTGSANVNIGGRPIKLGKTFVDDIGNHNIEADIKRIKAALLVMHSPIDTVVDISHASKIFAAAKHPKSYISLNKAEHVLNTDEDIAYVSNNLIAFANQYLIESKPLNQNTVTAKESSKGGQYTNEITVRHHQFLIDEPLSYGGDDLGPTPFEMLRAALASCTLITLRSYVNLKKLPVTKIMTQVEHRKEGQGAEKQDVFTRILIIEGDLTPEQRQKLLTIADRCPVHKALERTSVVHTLNAN